MNDFGRKKTEHENVSASKNVGETLDFIEKNNPNIDNKNLPDIATYHEAHHRKGKAHPDFTKIRNAALFQLLPKLDYDAAASLPHDELVKQLQDIIRLVLIEMKLNLNRKEEEMLETSLIDEILGLGPLEVLLTDPEVNDILINGPKQIFIERRGKLELTDIELRDEQHIRNIANRICARVGRHVSNASPLVDTRLEDGSRVNIILPPLSLRGTAISIRKFSVKPFTMADFVNNGTLSQEMANFLEASAASKMNIIISGGTGSGKTTLLNVLSQSIPDDERIITIEDSAELNLNQIHVLPLEARPANTDDEGEVTIRELVVNALRMRPDRIIVGEVRGGEIMDMLQAMNTGHEGSMGTVHANGPAQSLTRLENMASMAGFLYPIHVIRRQLAEALNIIVQISRMKDGKRRITSIHEIVGMEDDEIVLQELFKYSFISRDEQGNIKGDFVSSGNESVNIEKYKMFGYDDQVIEALKKDNKDGE
ncbi:CpaF family protein [Pseudemcibacter aquimaris]|uniref:CpaF family protein n=1 Tax=Pseudemcibacter aquimaris TaxID=2857064 RepID=UPI0020113548|nr:CpaF family protein [Pseudemcibacter aquimaris]MCC3861387.1 CpaF family protein [Pseudemcibacter aquimaris]WDU58157.1 CpaF family protein [Pseudemcibacter aquimaris]